MGNTIDSIIQWKHGPTQKNLSFVGAEKDITIDDNLHIIRVHDGTTAGGTPLILLEDVATKLSDLTDDVGVWRGDELVNISQLTNDSGFIKKSDLTKISQLNNNSGFLSSHCSYCSYCTYCSQCSNCYNCTTVDCTTVQCSKNCSDCIANCSACDCGDDQS